MKRKAISIFLAICLIVPIFSNFGPHPEVDAKEVDMFNLDISQTMDDKEKNDLKDNPYGKEGWFPLVSKKELVMSKTKKSQGRYQEAYKYNAQGNIDNRSKIGDFKESKDYSLINTVAFAPETNGREAYIAQLAYDEEDEVLRLFVLNQNRQVARCDVEGNPFLESVKSYHAMSHMAITAGDFDGDGKETIIVYAPNDLRLYEYEFNGSSVYRKREVIHIGDAMGSQGRTRLSAVMNEDNDNGSDELRATPSVGLTASDTDKDGSDELIFTANWNDLEQGEYEFKEGDKEVDKDSDWQCSWINIADLKNGGWSKTFSEVLDDERDETAKGRLRFAGVTVGNIATADGVDYPEIIVGGFIDQDSGNDCNIDEGNFSLYTYSMAEKNGKPDKYVRKITNEHHEASEFLEGGLYDDDEIQDPFCVTAFAANGLGQAEWLFAEGDVFVCEQGEKFTFKVRDDYFDDDDDGIGRFIISNAAVVQAVSGNFDGNKEGKEQVAFTTGYKYKHGSGYFWRTWMYGYPNGELQCKDYGWEWYDDGSSAASVAAADMGDKDGIMAKIKGKQLNYTKPQVMAVLEATPYYKELSSDGSGELDLGNSATEYGMSTATGSEKTSSTSVSAGAIVGYENSAPGNLFGGGFEISITNDWTWETTKSTERSYTITYSNDTGENAVLMYRTPVKIYTFDIQDYSKGSPVNDTMQIGIQGQPSTSMITVDKYNEAAAANDMQQITGSMVSTPGNPGSYRQSLPYSEDDPTHSWQAGSIASGGGSGVTATSDVPYNTIGTVSQELTVTDSSSQSSSYEFNAELTGWGIVGGVKLGGSVGGGFGKGTTTIDSSGTVKTGIVSGRPDVLNAENYNFYWHFATWSQKLNDNYVPVMGYIVTGEQSPPSPGQNLALSEHTANSMKLTWESGDRSADEYVIYRYNPSSPYKEYTEVGRVNGGNAEEGVYSYTLRNLTERTTYQYMVTGVSVERGESTGSELATGTTLAESGKSITFDPIADVEVASGEAATFAIKNVDYGDYNSIYFQWQQKKVNGNWSDIEDANKSTYTVTADDTLNKTRYRCIVFGNTGDGNAVPYYSNIATLTVGQSAVESTLTVKNYDSGKGTKNAPYVGTANYVTTKETSGKETSDEPVTVDVAVALASGETETVKAPVYKVSASGAQEDGTQENYAAIAQTSDGKKYYAVTKDDSSGASVYTAGEELLYKDIITYMKGDAAYEWKGSETPLTITIDGAAYTRYAVLKGTFNEPARENTEGQGGLGQVIGESDGKLTAVSQVTGQYISKDDKTFYPYTEGMTKLPEQAAEIGTDEVLTELYGYQPANSETSTAETYLIGHTDTTYTKKEIAADDGDESAGSKIVYAKDEISRLYEVTKADAYAVSVIDTSVETVLSAQGENADAYPEIKDPIFEAVTSSVEKEVTYVTQENHSGKELQLDIKTTRTVSNGGSTQQADAGNAQYIVYLVNQTTGNIDTLTGITNEKGLATEYWTAPAAGFYGIYVVTTKNETAVQYYLAKAAADSEFTILMSEADDVNNEPITRSVYGETVKLATYEIQADTQTPIEDIKYFYRKTDAQTDTQTEITTPLAFRPDSAGTYMITAKKDDKELASNVLVVSRRSIVLRPTWSAEESGTAPARLGEFSAKCIDDTTLAAGDQDKLNGLYTISCNAYKSDGTLDENLSGAFEVTMSWKMNEEGSGYIDEVKAFLSNYDVALENHKIIRKKDSFPVEYTAGENGILQARYGENAILFNSKDLIQTDSKLEFTANPEGTGFMVDQWYVNGNVIEPGDKVYQLSNGNKRLTIDKFAKDNLKDEQDQVLYVEVTFKTTSHTVSYSVGTESEGKGKITAALDGGQPVENGGSVKDGANVIFTAVPEEGYSVSGWTVDGEIHRWAENDEVYRGKTLTLEQITKAKTVQVFFEKVTESYTVNVNPVDEEGKTDQSLAVFTAVYAEDEEPIAVNYNEAVGWNRLSEEVKKHRSVRLTAKVASEANEMVKEWQISTTKDGNYKTIAGSGAKESITLYNLESSAWVRCVVTSAQTHKVSYEVQMDGKTVTDEAIAALAVTSNGQSLTSGEEVSAYIPIDFALSLHDNYEIVKWSDNVIVEEGKPEKASLASLDKDITVIVSIKEKPVVTIPESANGTITVTYQKGEETVRVTDGMHVPGGTNLMVSVTPDKGYIVQEAEDIQYTDGEGDTKVYTISDVNENITITADYQSLQQYEITHEIIKTSGSGDTYGELTAASGRKNIPSYDIPELSSGTKVYQGADVTLTAAPQEGYRVKQWLVNGEVMKKDGLIVTENVLSLKDIQKETHISVQFTVMGSSTSIEAGEHGKITSAMVGNTDLMNSLDGFVLAEGTSVAITAQPDAGYEVDNWFVNNEPAGETDNQFTYTPKKGDSGAQIRVTFRQKEYTVQWEGENGTVTREGDNNTSASIRGGTEVTFHANENEGFVFSHWTVNGMKIEGEEKTSLTWIVPNGEAAVPAEKTYIIKAVFIHSSYKVTYEKPENGMLTADVPSGSMVKSQTSVNFTAQPHDGYIVGSWIVNGEVIDSQSTTHKVDITKATEVSVQMIPASYNVTVKVTGGEGLVNGEKETTVSVPYGENLVLTAEPEEYWKVKQWMVDGTPVTEGLNDDHTKLSLTQIKENCDVEVSFTGEVFFSLSYEALDGDGTVMNDTLEVKAENKELSLEDGSVSENLVGGSRISFKATPPAGKMIGGWFIDDNLIPTLNNTLEIEKLDHGTKVKVRYVDYEGYDIPASNNGYIISDVTRTPDDTEPAEEIRKNGTVSFRVSLDKEKDFNVFETLIINGYDCLQGKWSEGVEMPSGCDNVEVVKDEDGSYVVTISNITDEIVFTAQAHSYDKPVFTWNGTASAKADFVCMDDNSHVLTLDTQLTAKKTEADCMTDGKIVYTASVSLYGETYTETKTEVISALGHQWIWVTDPQASVGEPGLQQYKCSRCGTVQTSVKIPAVKADILAAKVSSAKRNSLKISWGAVKEADGYYIYGAPCSVRKFKKLKTVGSHTLSWKSARLKSGKMYKYYVVAYKNINGKKVAVSTSLQIHAATTGGKFGNPKKIKPNKTSLTLNVKKKKKLKAKIIGNNIEYHINKVRWISSDTSVAKVNAKGVVRGISKGTCRVYCVAQNGIRKAVKVTVK